VQMMIWIMLPRKLNPVLESNTAKIKRGKLFIKKKNVNKKERKNNVCYRYTRVVIIDINTMIHIYNLFLL